MHADVSPQVHFQTEVQNIFTHCQVAAWLEDPQRGQIAVPFDPDVYFIDLLFYSLLLRAGINKNKLN